ncbi:MAG TPA: hypothetical protein VH234_01240 [Candidatus Saccharimonadales bacterium]|jgi:hypothetical protein|nr:hypothetical protein [Candidatus Saccharimonadales bacterium]
MSLTKADLQSIRTIVKDTVSEEVRPIVKEVIRAEVRPIIKEVIREEVRPIVKEEVRLVFQTEGREIVREEISKELKPINLKLGKIEAIENDIKAIYYMLSDLQNAIKPKPRFAAPKL